MNKPSNDREYPALVVIILLIKLISILNLFGWILISIKINDFAVFLDRIGLSTLSNSWLITLLIGIISSIFIWGVAESKQVIIDIESNTRKKNEFKTVELSENEIIKEKNKILINFQGGFKVDDRLISSVKYFEKATWEEANEICKNYSSDGYINWRLPSIEELEKIHKNIFTKEMKINDDSVYWNSDLIYWSSTLDSEVFVNCLKFKSGRRTTNYGKNNHFRFIAVRDID